MDKPMTEKQIMRKKLIAKRTEIFSENGEEYSEKICENLEKLATYRYADGYLLFYPLKNEVNVLSAMEKLLKKKKVYLPRCKKGEEGVMYFYEISSFDDLEEGSFKVMEPKEDCREVSNFSSNTVCIVPAVAYDREGYRIGYGKGYYDRFLRRYSGTKIGVVFSELIFDRLPKGRYDHAVDYLVTEKGVIKING